MVDGAQMPLPHIPKQAVSSPGVCKRSGAPAHPKHAVYSCAPSRVSKAPGPLDGATLSLQELFQLWPGAVPHGGHQRAGRQNVPGQTSSSAKAKLMPLSSGWRRQLSPLKTTTTLSEGQQHEKEAPSCLHAFSSGHIYTV